VNRPEPLVVLDGQSDSQGCGPSVVPWVRSDPHGHRVIAMSLLVATLTFQGERDIGVPP